MGKFEVLAALAAFAVMQVTARVLITNVELESDPDYIKSSVSLRKEDGRVLVTGEGFVFQDIVNDVVFSAALSVLSDGRFEVLGRLEPMSFCKFVASKKKTHPLIKLAMKNVQRYGNIPTSCPIKKGRYYVTDFELDEGLIPALAPSGHYKIEVVFSTVGDFGANKVIHKVVAYAAVEQNAHEDEESSESYEE